MNGDDTGELELPDRPNDLLSDVLIALAAAAGVAGCLASDVPRFSTSYRSDLPGLRWYFKSPELALPTKSGSVPQPSQLATPRWRLARQRVPTGKAAILDPG